MQLLLLCFSIIRARKFIHLHVFTEWAKKLLDQLQIRITHTRIYHRSKYNILFHIRVFLFI